MTETKELAAFSWKEGWKEATFWWWALGTVIGSLSVINFVQKVFNVGLAPIPKMILDYYRAAIAPVRDVLQWLVQWLLPLKLPEWYVDLYVLSFIFALAMARSVISRNFTKKVSVLQEIELFDKISPGFYWLEKERRWETAKSQLQEYLFYFLVSLFTSIILMGLFLPLWAISKRPFSEHNRKEYTEAVRRYISNWHEGMVDMQAFELGRRISIQRTFLVSFGVMLLTSIAFFIWNFQDK